MALLIVIGFTPTTPRPSPHGPEIRLYNLELLDKYGSEDQAVVFARIEAHPDRQKTPAKPRIFVLSADYADFRRWFWDLP